jgi:UDP-glucose 4-epimerase
MRPHVLITGGLGYLGGRIAEYLIKDQQIPVSITTRHTTRTLPPWLSEDNVLNVDILSSEEANRACRDIDVIIHLAAMNEIDSSADPSGALLVNTLGTLRIVEAATTNNVQRCIYFSTAHVYRSPLVGVIHEGVIPRPVHPYAITHRAAEDYVLAAHTQGELQGVVLRLSNAIGAPISPDVNRWTLIGNDLCRQAIVDHKLTLKTTGLQQRDFIPMKDVCTAVSHALFLPENKIGSGVFNLGSGRSCSVFDLATRVQERSEKVVGYTPEIIRPKTHGENNANELIYQIDRLGETGFMPSGDLDQAIDETLRFCETFFKET